MLTARGIVIFERNQTGHGIAELLQAVFLPRGRERMCPRGNPRMNDGSGVAVQAEKGILVVGSHFIPPIFHRPANEQTRSAPSRWFRPAGPTKPASRHVSARSPGG